jgi:radical SAM superfamily enzyme YgiQ (UPF0313 family)
MLQSDVNVVLVSDCVVNKTAGIYRIATEIREANYTCQVIDNISSFSQSELSKILNIIVGKNTLAIGFSTTFISRSVNQPTFSSFFHPFTEAYRDTIEKVVDDPESAINTIFQISKSINPKVKILIGGAKAGQINNSAVDNIVLGYADEVVVDYLDQISGKVGTVDNTRQRRVINGMECNRRFNFTTSQIKYHPSDNIIPQQKVLSLEISRGCIFKCKFCAFPMNGKKKNGYIKDAVTLREEFLRNFNEYGITHYIFMDDTFNDSSEKLTSVANIVRNLPFQMYVTCYLRIDLLRAHPEQYQILRDIGLSSCQFGIESLNHESLKCIGKGLHPDKVVNELYKFKDEFPEVTTQGSFICGLPYETKESITETANLIMQESFPLDFPTMTPLGISNVINENELWFSEFSREAGKYYSWTNNKWHNGNFDVTWALKFAHKFYVRSITSGRARVSCWAAAIYLNLGFSESILGKPMLVTEKDYQSKFTDAINSYKQLVLDGKIYHPEE